MRRHGHSVHMGACVGRFSRKHRPARTAGIECAFGDHAVAIWSDRAERFLVCGEAGRFALSAPGRGLAPWRRSWKQVRRGDALRVTAPERRESGWGLGPDSGLEIL